MKKAILILFVLSILTTQSAWAQALSFTISPPTVKKTLTPGISTQGILKVTNSSDTPLTFLIGKEDFVVLDDSGTPVKVPEGTADKFAASHWISFDQNSVDIDAHDTGSVVYTITPPTYVSPGGYYLAVTFQPQSAQATKTQATIQPVIQALFLLTIPGNTKEDARITQFAAPDFQEYGPIAITTQVQNNSDIHIKPVAMIAISDMLGRQVALLSLEQHNIFPGGIKRIYKNTLEKHWLLGMYTARISLSYGKTNHLLSAKTTFIVFPWKIAVVITLIVILILLASIYLRKRKTTVIEAEIAIGQQNNPQ